MSRLVGKLIVASGALLLTTLSAVQLLMMLASFSLRFMISLG